MARRLKLTPHETLEIRSSTAEVLEVEATYGGGSGKPPPPHYHPAQDEHFEVVSGSVRARIGEREVDLGPGETLEIPSGTPHQMWNPHPEEARVLWQTRPRLRTEEWWSAIDSLYRDGRVGSNGMPGPLAYGALISEYDDVFRLAVGPEPLVRGGIGALGWLGRLRGYRPAASSQSDAADPTVRD